ncbi:MAG: transporter [Burkholderiaceae bacterium]|nr:MAG: transporter [Burkholderiaceae bacterium]
MRIKHNQAAIAQNMRTLAMTSLFASCLFATSAMAQEAKTEPIATDRPDFVESGQVVGKGRFQFETGFNYDRSKADGITAKSLSNSALLRFGFGETWEFRIETDGFIRATTSGLGVSNSQNGFGDTALGFKWQMQDGDDASGRPAIAWLVHADMASGSKEFRGQGTRPSVRAVFEWDLADDASFGIMPGIMLNRNDAGKRYNMGILAAT